MRNSARVSGERKTSSIIVTSERECGKQDKMLAKC